jgi:FixJ family two-component response regulator
MAKRPEAQAIVYIVDDDVNVREGLTALLASVGLRSEAFGSTREFLQRERGGGPSCLILDVRLQGASGLDFQRELAGLQLSIPVVFISAHGDVPMTVKAMQGGAVGFLTKPIHEQELLDTVNIALDRDRASRQQQNDLQDLRNRFEALSPREQEVMAMVTGGLLNKQTAAKIGVSEVTVKVHRHNVMKKLGAKSLPDLVRIADALGIAHKKPF